MDEDNCYSSAILMFSESFFWEKVWISLLVQLVLSPTKLSFSFYESLWLSFILSYFKIFKVESFPSLSNILVSIYIGLYSKSYICYEKFFWGIIYVYLICSFNISSEDMSAGTSKISKQESTIVN